MIKPFDFTGELDFIEEVKNGLSPEEFKIKFIDIYGWDTIISELSFRVSLIRTPEKYKESDDDWAAVGVDPVGLSSLEFNSYLILDNLLRQCPVEDYPEKWL